MGLVALLHQPDDVWMQRCTGWLCRKANRNRPRILLIGIWWSGFNVPRTQNRAAAAGGPCCCTPINRPRPKDTVNTHTQRDRQLWQNMSKSYLCQSERRLSPAASGAAAAGRLVVVAAHFANRTRHRRDHTAITTVAAFHGKLKRGGRSSRTRTTADQHQFATRDNSAQAHSTPVGRARTTLVGSGRRCAWLSGNQMDTHAPVEMHCKVPTENAHK